jgi:hypothetical protein
MVMITKFATWELLVENKVKLTKEFGKKLLKMDKHQKGYLVDFDIAIVIEVVFLFRKIMNHLIGHFD